MIPRLPLPLADRAPGPVRAGAFFAVGFQDAPALDALLWLLDVVLPPVLEAAPGFELHVPAHPWRG